MSAMSALAVDELDLIDVRALPVAVEAEPTSHPRSPSSLTLAAAVLGFFVITLDAVVVNVALPSIRGDFGGGITGLSWVVDGYTLMFAALLLWAGALSDRIGGRRAFGAGLSVFVAASASCGPAHANAGVARLVANTNHQDRRGLVGAHLLS